MVEPLSIRIAGTDVARLVHVSGEVDLATAPLLTHALRQIDAGTVTVALGDVTFLDACGLRCLVQEHKRLSESGGALRVVGAAPIVQRTFEITGLDHVLSEAPLSPPRQSPPSTASPDPQAQARSSLWPVRC